MPVDNRATGVVPELSDADALANGHGALWAIARGGVVRVRPFPGAP